MYTHIHTHNHPIHLITTEHESCDESLVIIIITAITSIIITVITIITPLTAQPCTLTVHDDISNGTTSSNE